MPQTDFLPAVNPRLENLAACEGWLARASLPDSPSSVRDLSSLLDEVESAPPSHFVYLQILERLRHPVTMAQTALARRFAGKPLPLDYDESAALVQSSTLWRAMLRAYTRLLKAALSGRHPELRTSLPILFHRVLACCTELIGGFWLARRGFSADHWQLLHQTYASAESHGVSQAPVSDLRCDASVTSAYAEAILIELAQPYGLSLREFGWARSWIRSWSRKVAITREAPGRGAVVVDLSGRAGPSHATSAARGPGLRYLDVGGLIRHIDQLLRALKNGEKPEALGLGNDCPALVAQALLRTLSEERFASDTPCDASSAIGTSPVELVSGFAAIHHAIEGAPLVQPARPAKASYSYGEADRFQTFRHDPERGSSEVHAQGGERWEMIEGSGSEFRLRRGSRGMRLAHRQLVALRSAGAREFVLCHIDWLAEGPDQTLTIGAHALQGAAKACAVRRADRAAQGRSDALMLPVSPGAPAALVLPAGWYERARELELKLGNGVSRVTLAGLVDRGFDYEHVTVS